MITLLILLLVIMAFIAIVVPIICLIWVASIIYDVVMWIGSRDGFTHKKLPPTPQPHKSSTDYIREMIAEKPPVPFDRTKIFAEVDESNKRMSRQRDARGRFVKKVQEVRDEPITRYGVPTRERFAGQ